MYLSFLDDEEVSLVIEAACPVGGHAADVNHAADAPDDDTLSVGPDMPDLPLDAPPDPETLPEAASAPKEVQPAEKEQGEATSQEEQGSVEEETTVREEPLTPEPQVEQAEGESGEQQQEGGEEGQQEKGDVEQGEETAAQAEEEVTAEGREAVDEAQSEPHSDCAIAEMTLDEATAVEAPPEENTAPQEAPVGPAEGAPQEVGEGGERSCAPCSCQSLLSNYNSNAHSRRKTRPCSLPVSELETVIASACGEPETPRSHYIRIHHLLHSLPSAQHRPPSQEEEQSGEGVNTDSTVETNSTSPTHKTSKEQEGQEDDEEEDTSQSPSQVGAVMGWLDTC